jgi:hypothetical protein
MQVDNLDTAVHNRARADDNEDTANTRRRFRSCRAF